MRILSSICDDASGIPGKFYSLSGKSVSLAGISCLSRSGQRTTFRLIARGRLAILKVTRDRRSKRQKGIGRKGRRSLREKLFLAYVLAFWAQLKARIRYAVRLNGMRSYTTEDPDRMRSSSITCFWIPSA